MIRSKLLCSFKGQTNSITIHHDEIPVAGKPFSFSASQDEIRDSFLSEEEYFNVVKIKGNGSTIQLKGAKRINMDNKGDRYHFTFSFTEMVSGNDE